MATRSLKLAAMSGVAALALLAVVLATRPHQVDAQPATSADLALAQPPRGRNGNPASRPETSRSDDPKTHGRRDAPPSPEELDDLLGVLRYIHPEKADLIAQVRQKDPERIGELLREFGPTLKGLIDIRKRDPELFQLRADDMALGNRSTDLAKRVQAAEAAKAQELRKQLEELVGRHFDVRQKLRERDLKSLQERVESFRKEMEARRKGRDEYIKKRVKELLASGAEAARRADTQPAPERRDRPAHTRPGKDQVTSPEELNNLLALLREINPQRAAEIQAIRQKTPELVTPLLQEYAGTLRSLLEAQRKDPEMYKLRLDDFKLGSRLAELVRQHAAAQKAGDKPGADKAQKELEAVLGRQFDVRDKMRERELKALEDKVGDFRKEIDLRRAARDELVKRRLKELVPAGEEEKKPQW